MTVDQRASSWPIALSVAGIGSLIILFWFWPTALSIEAIWRRSGNFTHGYVIVPIAGYMLWVLKDDILKFTPRPAKSAVLIAGFGAFLWAMARLVDVLVVEQLALVIMIQALWVTVLGWRLATVIIVPLLYLFFAVPFGQGLEPYLQDYTAWFSVQALKLSGIPVLWEGLFITIPSGAFEVAEACSGMRYLVASVALGVLYAFLNFQSWRYKLFFVALSIAVPIVANGIRAYLIIILAHLSNNRLAVGVDHLIYGWLFFGLVMYLLFLFGNRLRGRERGVAAQHLFPTVVPVSSFSLMSWGLVALVLAVSIKPLYSKVFSTPRVVDIQQFSFPQAIDRWQHLSGGSKEWVPEYVGFDAMQRGNYQKAGGSIDYAVYFYANQQQGKELGGSANSGFNSDRWRLLTTSLKSGASPLRFVEQRLQSRYGSERLVWRIYWVSGEFGNSEIRVKLREAWFQLTGRYQGSAAVLVSALVNDGDVESTRELLKQFTAKAIPEIDIALSRVIDN